MKKRLRKKRRLGEFREYGFELMFAIQASLTAEKVDAVTDAFIDLIESRNLQFGGGGNHSWSGFVQGPSRGSATEQDREAILRWLAQHEHVVSATTGPLRDAWHGWPQTRS